MAPTRKPPSAERCPFTLPALGSRTQFIWTRVQLPFCRKDEDCNYTKGICFGRKLHCHVITIQNVPRSVIWERIKAYFITSFNQHPVKLVPFRTCWQTLSLVTMGLEALWAPRCLLLSLLFAGSVTEEGSLRCSTPTFVFSYLTAKTAAAKNIPGNLAFFRGRRSAGAKKVTEERTQRTRTRCDACPCPSDLRPKFPPNKRPSVRPSVLAGLKVEILRIFSGGKRFCCSSFSRVRRRFSDCRMSRLSI